MTSFEFCLKEARLSAALSSYGSIFQVAVLTYKRQCMLAEFIRILFVI